MLLIIVLSVLVLFLLIGTAFLMTSKQSVYSSKALAKVDRVGNNPGLLLDRALFALLRDTENPNSAARFHSLLRDMYGGDGFEGTVLRAEYAGVSDFPATAPVGPTVGQMIDIYVVTDATSLAPIAYRIDRDPEGLRTPYLMSKLRGAYSGQLVTIKSGPAAGQSARIVDYQFNAASNLYAFRVMTFPRADGAPLAPGGNASDLNALSDLAGSPFVVNGRPFNGTGVGYNSFAIAGQQARLSALELLSPPPATASSVFGEIALLPNATTHDDFQVYSSPGGQQLNTPRMIGRNTNPARYRYGNFSGPSGGGDDESYDAPDFQNMWLASQTPVPRGRGRYVTDARPQPFEFDDSTVTGNFQRFDLEDVPKPSFHDMALVNFWYYRLVTILSSSLSPDDAVRGIVDPYGASSPLTPQQAALVAAIKRKIMFRPSRDDHPKFDGGNPASVPPTNFTPPFGSLTTMNAINYPFPEIVGPWDVDNDGDGVADSVWIDLGDPVIETENGTRYRALYAVMIQDLDGRLNVNAHGTYDHLLASLSRIELPLATADPMAANQPKTNRLPQGTGWGPAEISLRPVMPYTNVAAPASPGGDDYARLFVGRPWTGLWGRQGSVDVVGLANVLQVQPGITYQGGPSTFTPSSVDPLSMMKFIGHPWYIDNYNPASPAFAFTAFGTPSDLNGRYTLGLDFSGNPVYEFRYDAAGQRLLTDSPYELDLSSRMRKDTPAADAITQMVASPGQPYRDDAPFATADLERILRAADADAGTLPSRLWEVVSSFDPSRMANDHPALVANAASQLFGASAGPPEQLATAQLLASVNRHQVTTDSWSVPVPGISPPAYMMTDYSVTPAAMPSRSDPDVFDDAPLLGLRPPKTVAELFEVRIRRYFGWPTLFDDYEPGGDHDGDLQINYSTLSNTWDPEFQSDPLRAARNTAINNIIPQIVAPESLAGVRMDINRPFGDGQDDGNLLDDNGNGAIDDALEVGIDPYMNGVVDDPLEAGDPFLDLNGNGKRDDGTSAPAEPFIDLDGNGYTPPQDKLWNGFVNEGAGYAEFDYLNGNGEPLNNAVNAALPGGPFQFANVRNLESQGRQRLARHLYCLMLLLMDENYVAPIDELDPQLMSWIAVEKAKITAFDPTVTPTDAEAFVRRKLTCREVAQWAINVVDLRDADAIMTPFEYDENPWDGWGVTIDPMAGIILPLDGDPATDENAGEIIDWNASNGGPKVVLTQANGSPVMPNPDPRFQTRGLVWGAERPDLLITETVAFYDRRTEDLATTFGSNQHRQSNDPDPNLKDTEPDQRLRPVGTLMVEVYNPTSPDGQHPAELYTPDAVNGMLGVQLGRLSLYAAEDLGNAVDPYGDGPMRLSVPMPLDNHVRRSPIWRMVTVSEPPKFRNADTFDDTRRDVTDQGMNLATGANGYRSAIDSEYTTAEGRVSVWSPTVTDPMPPFRPTNLNFGNLFDWSFLPTVVNPTATPSAGQPYKWNVTYPHIEREFYFTTDDSPTVTSLPGVSYPPTNNSGSMLRSVEADDFKMRIPRNRTITYQLGSTGGPGTPNEKLTYKEQTQKFVAVDPVTSTTDQKIAPILPGRYGVIGSAGHHYANFPASSFTTMIGRNRTATNDTQHYQNTNLLRTRRIELLPGVDPTQQQVLVQSNGGNPAASPIGRQNELVGTGQNIYMTNVFAPAVAIPVDDMNIAEPWWGWGAVERPLRRDEFNSSRNPVYKYSRGVEGAYEVSDANNNQTSFDMPFDQLMGAPELSRTGTTPNYRTIHLQRLANPLLPWNPLPGEPDHRPGIPVNPYRTIDLSSVDLTTFDGASDAENVYGTNRSTMAKWKPDGQRNNFMGASQNSRQHWYFKSLERGVYAHLGLVHPDAMAQAAGLSPLPQRELLAQEPAIGSVRDFNDGSPTTYRKIRDGRDVTMQRDATDPMESDVPMAIQTSENIQTNFLDMVLEHTLGFGNESLGELYTSADAAANVDRNGDGIGDFIGAPKPYQVLDSTGMPIKDAAGNDIYETSTFPWLDWPNRPFASAEEILQAPSADSSRMLAQFSVINPKLSPVELGFPKYNPYLTAKDGGRGVPFGHLLNMFAATPINGSGVNPNFYRILDYVQVPSRFVGTETVLNPAVFNDVPNASDAATGGDITSQNDPRFNFQPPFNKVSRQRDPGRVNLNTVTGRRVFDPTNGLLRIWSEVYDGIMHRYQDKPLDGQTGHFGPAWRDVLLSRRGYAQINADSSKVDQIGASPSYTPDTLSQGLNPNFPTFAANPFRSPDAGDLVPIPQMVQTGVDVTLLRRHHYSPLDLNTGADAWGISGVNDDYDPTAPSGVVDDVQEAGFGDDMLTADSMTDRLIANESRLPLFSETYGEPFYDGKRNPALMYQPAQRIENLVTNRSNVFAVWITVGYFEVEKAPDYASVAAKFNNDINLYNRVYPEGYQLGRELGSDTGNTQRHRGFYIIDRTTEVGFKPGEDLNVEKAILLRRRIE